MGRNPSCTVYIGNLDEKVSEKVLYEVLIQVGHVVDLHIPWDKETNHHKGFAFAEYESEEIAEYAVRLFSGLVRLHKKTLKFAMSGQDMPLPNQAVVQSKPNSAVEKPHLMIARDTEMSKGSSQSRVNHRVSAGTISSYSGHPPGSANRLALKGLSKSNFGYSRRVFGTMLNNVSRPGDKHPVAHASF